MSWMLIADSWPMHYLVIPWCGQWCCCYYQLCFTGTDMCSKCGAIFNILLKVVIVELYCSFVVIRHAVNRHILESLFLLTDSRGTCYFTCGTVRSIVISVSVFLCICLFDQKSHPNLTNFFVNVLSVFAAQSFSRDTADDVMCLHNGHMQIASRNNSLAVEVNMHNE